MVKLSTLAVGTRFRYPDLGKEAVVVGQGPSGSRVLFDNARRFVTFQPRTLDGGEVSFEAPGSPVLVSSFSDVEVMQ